MPFLNDLPVVITGPGWYLLRNGRAAHIDQVAPVTNPGVTAFRAKGDLVSRLMKSGRPQLQYMIWHVSGRIGVLGESPRDIIGALPDFDPTVRDWFVRPGYLQQRVRG